MPELQADDELEVVAMRKQPGAGPSRTSSVKSPAERSQAGRRRNLQGRQQRPADVIDLTADRDDDEVQITQVKNVKRQKTRQVASPAPVAKQVPPPAPPSPKGYKCIICLERMESDMATTTCGHMFCYKCISAWVQKSGNCPQCRTKLTKSKIIRVYPPT